MGPLKKRATIVINLAVLLVVSGCSSAAKKKDAKLANIYLTAGASSLHKGNVSSAITNLKKSLEKAPKQPEALSNLGVAYFQKGRHKLAKKNLQKAIKIDKNFHDAKFNLALVYFSLKEDSLAERSFRAITAIPEYQRNFESYFYLGELYKRNGKPQKSHIAFRKSIEENEHFCPGWLRLGESHWRVGNKVESRSALEKATTGLCYPYIEGHYRLASVLVQLKNLDLARKKFKELIQRFPKSTWAKKSKGKLALLRGDF